MKSDSEGPKGISNCKERMIMEQVCLAGGDIMDELRSRRTIAAASAARDGGRAPHAHKSGKGLNKRSTRRVRTWQQHPEIEN